MNSNFIDNSIAWDAHVAGECDEDCIYCEMENEINQEYEFVEQKNIKKASNSKNEKALRKQ